MKCEAIKLTSYSVRRVRVADKSNMLFRIKANQDVRYLFMVDADSEFAFSLNCSVQSSRRINSYLYEVYSLKQRFRR